MTELVALEELVGARRQLRGAALRRRHRRPAARGAAAARPGARDGDRDHAAVLRAGVGRARRRTRRGAARDEGLEFCRHHLRMQRRYRPHLLSEPEEKMMAEKAVTGPQRLGAAVRRADLGASGCAAATGRRGRRGARGRAEPPAVARPRGAPGRGGGGHRGARARACARAPTSSTRCSTTRRWTTACATTRTGWPRATWPTRPPTSRSRRSSMRCAAATRSPQRWYRLKAQLLGVDRLADYDRIGRGRPRRTRTSPGARGARARARLLHARSRPSWATLARRFFDEPGSTRRCARQARRRVLRLHRARDVHPT